MNVWPCGFVDGTCLWEVTCNLCRVANVLAGVEISLAIDKGHDHASNISRSLVTLL